MSNTNNKARIKAQIYRLLGQYFEVSEPPFDPVTHRVALSVPTYGANDVIEALDSLLGGWPTVGPKVRQVEDKIAGMLGVRNAIMVSSGGAANFLSLYLLASPYAHAGDRLKPGDEIITPAVTWITTVAPIIQVGCVPVLVDVNLSTYDIDLEQVESNINKNTKAIFIVHPLGHACEMNGLLKLCEKHNLLLLEDTCESLGTRYADQYAGTFGSFATFSFYFSHHITSVEGGMIVTDDDDYADALRSMRANGWFREIRDESRRHDLQDQHADIDTSFLFPFIGFNLKPTDVAAGLLLGQIDRLDNFIQSRRAAAEYLNQRLLRYSDLLHLPYERKPCRHGWFAYPIVVKDDAPFTRIALVEHLRLRRIDNRPIVAGNIATQPFLRDFQFKQGDLPNSDRVMKNGFFLGIHHHMDSLQVKYVADVFDEFFEGIMDRKAG